MMDIGLSVFAAISLVIVNEANGLKVSVYYEALCPDSINFINRQLYPHYSELAKHVELDLIPYGKAAHGEYNGIWQFSCQHGPQECKGNKYQSCVLAHNKDSESNVPMINCIMRHRNPSLLSNVENCARRHNADVQRIKSCASSGEGDRLLALNGDKTWNLEPSISFVPTIIYDDKFDQVSQDQSLKDFVAVVCSKINLPKPSVCDNRSLPKVNLWGHYY